MVIETTPWSLTQADIDSITDLEVAKSTHRLLPPLEDIPAEIMQAVDHDGQNIYVDIVQAMYVGDPPPPGDVQFNAGYEANDTKLQRLIQAHLQSLEPEFEHKIGGIAFMLSQILTVTPTD